MAVIKLISIKNSNHNAVTDYLTTQHDKFTDTAILDEKRIHILLEEFILEGIHCDAYSFRENIRRQTKILTKIKHGICTEKFP